MEINTMKKVNDLYRSVKEVMSNRIQEGITNLPIQFKEEFCTEEVDNYLNELVAKLEKQSDWNYDDLIELSSLYFLMAMSEKLYDEMEETEGK